MAGLIPLGGLVAASDTTNAANINKPGSKSRAAVDARVQPIVVATIAEDATVVDAAAAAVVGVIEPQIADPESVIGSAVAGMVEQVSAAEVRRNLFADPNAKSLNPASWGPTSTGAVTLSNVVDARTWVRSTRTGVTTTARILDMLVGTTLLPSTRYRIRARVRRASAPATVSVNARPDMASATGNVLIATGFVIPVGESILDLTFTTSAVAPTATAGITLMGDGTAAGGALDVTDVLVELASTSGTKTTFSGDSPDDGLEQYRWLGPPNASPSVAETRLAPISKELATGRLSEEALNAEFAPRSEVVPADRVGLLVKTPDVRAYSAASDTVQRMEIPGHTAGASRFQATHPSVKFFPKGWNGYRYWIAFTPYPFGAAAHEDPNIAVSQDGKTWVTPPGFTNPLDDAPDSTRYNADTELAISPDGLTMYCMWRFTDTTAGTVQFKIRSTTDGVTWTAAQVVMTQTLTVANYVSPTLAHDGTQWVMWGIDTVQNPNALVRVTAPEITGPWSAPTVCTASADAGRDFWHIAVIRTVDGYLMIMNDCAIGQSGIDGDLFLMSSPDGLTWTKGPRLFKRPFGSEFTAQYRATLVPTDAGFDVWFGAWNTATNVWAIFRAQLTRTVPPLAVATGGRPSPAVAGAGAMVFDTTLNKPIWSTGTGWVDATGSPVA